MSGSGWVRVGIDEWDRLAPPLIPKTQQIDQNRRAVEVASICQKLMNWDGRQSRLRDLMALIEEYVRESGSPSMQPGSVQVET